MTINSTRRGFLGGAVSLAAMSGGMPAAPQASEDVRLGVASYSLREFQRGLAIKMIKQCNIPYVSVKEMHLPYRSTPEELRRGVAQFHKAGLQIVGGGVVYMLKNDDDDIRQYFEYAKACGMPLLTIGPTHETLPKIEKFVKEYNIKVAIHNHGPEDKNFPSPEVALKAVEGMDARVGLCIDVGHTARTGTNPVQAVRDAGSRLLDMHFKDLRNLMDKGSQVPVGDGEMPVVQIFQQLKKMNYPGYVNLEYEVDGDSPLMGMQKSFSYMRGVLAGMRG